MELNTISLSDFTKLADVIWHKGYASVDQAFVKSGMVNVVNIPQNSGNTREFSSVDTNEYLTYKGQSDQAARGLIQQGYSATMTAYREGENIGISYEMRTQNKYPEVVSTLMRAGEKGANTIDLDLSHRITFGTATSYTDKDGRTIDVTTGASTSQQLFDTDHPLKGSTTTYRNRLANNPRLSKGALEGIERLIVEQTYNEVGEKMMMPFDILWTTDDPNTVNTAREYLKSTADVGAANASVINVYKGKYKHVILPRVATTALGVTDTDKRYYWGLASSKGCTLYLGIWENPHLIPPAANENSEDAQTDDWEFRNRAGYGIAVIDGRWIKFSSGDGTA